MADDHLNVALATDGTLYAAVKTGWDTLGVAKIALLIRRPVGGWDPLYSIDDTGTRPVVILDELDDTLRLVYTSAEGLNDIVMRTSSTARIAFGPRETLMTGGRNDATTAKQNTTGESVVLASNGSVASGVRLPLHQPGSNHAPVFSTDLGNRSDPVGAVVSMDADASDIDGDLLVYSATGLPDGISINAATGVISGTIGASSPGLNAVNVFVTDGTESDVDGFSWTVAAAAPTTYASDNFSRTVNNNWGTAPTGGAWTLTGTAADFDVTGSTGTLNLPAGNSRLAALASVSAQNLDLGFRFAANKVPSGGSLYAYAAARRVSATTSYRVKVRIAPNGQVFVQATSVVANTETAIGSEVLVPGLTNTPGSFIRIRAQFTGTNPTTIRIRAWADGSTEPSTWLYTATNSVASLQQPVVSDSSPTSPAPSPMARSWSPSMTSW